MNFFAPHKLAVRRSLIRDRRSYFERGLVKRVTLAEVLDGKSNVLWEHLMVRKNSLLLIFSSFRKWRFLLWAVFQRIFFVVVEITQGFRRKEGSWISTEFLLICFCCVGLHPTAQSWIKLREVSSERVISRFVTFPHFSGNWMEHCKVPQLYVILWCFLRLLNYLLIGQQPFHSITAKTFRLLARLYYWPFVWKINLFGNKFLKCKQSGSSDWYFWLWEVCSRRCSISEIFMNETDGFALHSQLTLRWDLYV